MRWCKVAREEFYPQIKRIKKENNFFATSRDEVETGFRKAGAMSIANGNAQRTQRRKEFFTTKGIGRSLVAKPKSGWSLRQQRSGNPQPKEILAQRHRERREKEKWIKNVKHRTFNIQF
jgi:hypothetical protein